MTELNLHVDSVRLNTSMVVTGIYVRAYDTDRKIGNFDIAVLDTESLLTWLRSRGGDNVLAEHTVLILLDHAIPGINFPPKI